MVFVPQPSSGPLKYFQLAQLEDGHICLSLYTKGISLLEASLSDLLSAPPKQSKKSKKTKKRGALEGGSREDTSEAPEVVETKSRLVAAYCAVAELYFTDLCDQADAETNAESAIKRALELQPESAEALLCDAQLKKVRGVPFFPWCCCCYCGPRCCSCCCCVSRQCKRR